MIIRLIPSIALIFTLSCSSNKKSNEEISKVPNITYPYHLIDSLGLKQSYDSARWLLYEKQSRDTLQWSIACKETDKYTLGELGLGLESLEIRSDTIEFNFCYTLPPKYSCKNLFVGNECIIKTIGINISTQKLLYYKTACNFDVAIDGFFEKKMQETKGLFANYVKDNFEKLNPWFKEEIVKRKIINK